MENTDNQVLFLVMNFAYLEVDGWAATQSIAHAWIWDVPVTLLGRHPTSLGFHRQS